MNETGGTVPFLSQIPGSALEPVTGPRSQGIMNWHPAINNKLATKPPPKPNPNPTLTLPQP